MTSHEGTAPKAKMESIETPEYWPSNPQLKSPKKYYELQFAFAKLMAERRNIPLMQAVKDYAPIVHGAIHEMDEERNTLEELVPGVTKENILERAWESSQERRAKLNTEQTPYYSEKDLRFGCHSYDYNEDTKTVRVHFANLEAEDEWVDGKSVSTGPLSEGKLTRRKAELTQMFKDIQKRHPDAKYVRGCSNLYNLESYRRLYPPTYVVGDIDYDEKRWSRGMAIWGQFLGGNDKQKGEFGFKQKLAEEFLENAKHAPLDKLVDALPMPPRTAHGNIQDFYTFYGIETD